MEMTRNSITQLVAESTIPAIYDFLDTYQKVYFRCSHATMGEIDFKLFGMKRGDICDVLQVHSRHDKEMIAYSSNHELKGTYKRNPYKDPWGMTNRLCKVKMSV